MNRLIELSHQIVPGMKTYPELPEPRAEVLLDYEASRERYKNQAEFLIASLHLCGNTGTYVDSPRHRYREGRILRNFRWNGSRICPSFSSTRRRRAARSIEETSRDSTSWEAPYS